MGLFAVTRWPGMLPGNFSPAYGLAFCAGVYLPSPWKWIAPMVTLALTDALLNVHYGEPVLNLYSIIVLTTFGAIVWLGTRFSTRSSWLKLVTGGMLGAVIFYLVTNTLSWIYDSAYPKTLQGWLQALTTGRPGMPSTWEFFRNTLLSGGLFTGLFAGAMKWADATAEKETQEASEDSPETPEAEGPRDEPKTSPAR